MCTLCILLVVVIPRELYQVGHKPSVTLRASLQQFQEQLSTKFGSLRSLGDSVDEPRCPSPAASSAAADGTAEEGMSLPVHCAFMHGWVCGVEYRAYRFVISARTFLYFAAGIFQASGLYYINSYIAGTNGETVLAIALIITLVIAATCAAPVGWAADRVGPVPCVYISSLLLGLLFAVFSYTTSTTVLIAISPALGLGLLLYAVADLSLIIASLPDPTQRARDIGFWNAFQSVGYALGAAFVTPAIATFGRATADDAPFYNATVIPEETLPYTRDGYHLIFWTGTAAIVFSCLFVWLAQRALRMHPAASSRASLCGNSAGQQPGSSNPSASAKEAELSEYTASSKGAL